MVNSFKQPPFPDLLLGIAADIGTPTYVYFESIVRRQIAALREGFSALSPTLLYAMKANANPALLKVMLRAGVGIDAVSPGELALALKLGFPRSSLLFSANNAAIDEIEFAIDAGVTINIGELSRLEAVARRYPGTEVSVRLNLALGAGHHEYVVTGGPGSKFGIPADQLPSLLQIASDGDLRIVGLHQHIGSGNLNPDVVSEAMIALLKHAGKLEHLRFVNFGGGFGVPYRPGERPMDLKSVASKIQAHVQSLVATTPNLRTVLEPGRYLVAEAGVLLVRVVALKHATDRTFAGTDSGMGHLIRPSMYNAYHAVSNLSNPHGVARKYDVVGNICESGDFFARDRPVTEIREGDVLAILDTGAYGMSMASDYNLRSLPAEVVVATDGTPNLARRRSTANEIADDILTRAVTTSAED